MIFFVISTCIYRLGVQGARAPCRKISLSIFLRDTSSHNLRIFRALQDMRFLSYQSLLCLPTVKAIFAAHFLRLPLMNT